MGVYTDVALILKDVYSDGGQSLFQLSAFVLGHGRLFNAIYGVILLCVPALNFYLVSIIQNCPNLLFRMHTLLSLD